MKRKRLHSLSVVAISTLCHASSYLQFCTWEKTSAVPSHYQSQFAFLLLFSLAISVLLVLALNTEIRRKQTVLYLGYLIQLYVLILIGLPLSENLQIEFAMLTLLVVEAALFFHFPSSIIMSCFASLLVLLVQMPINAWHLMLPGASGVEIMALGIYSVVLILGFNYARYLFQEWEKRDISLSHLNNVISKLSQANVVFQDYAIYIEEMSKVQERNRIIREIHDAVGYALTNLIIMMEAATDLNEQNSEKLPELIQEARGQAQEALQETRRALRDLKSVESTERQGILAIAHLVKVIERVTNIKIRFEFGNSQWSWGSEIDLVIYRIVQEGITNAFRHGKATKIDVLLWQGSDEVIVTISDNGIGSSGFSEGLGISGMRERVERFGGELSVTARTYGFDLSAKIPLGKESR